MKYLLLLIIVLSLNNGWSQSSQDPVQWTFEIKPLDDSDQYQVTATAIIKDDWQVYSSKIDEGGPIGTSLDFEDEIRIISDIIEPLPAIEEEDSLFEMTLIKYKHKAVFERVIETDGQTKEVKGYLRFMTCNGQRCLPPTTIPFNLAI